MRNFQKNYLKIDKEYEEYVQKIKDTIYRLLESKGAKQSDGGLIHGTFNLLPSTPRLGKVFGCETNGTGFTFDVRVTCGYIEACGTIPGPAPVKMVTKKWYSVKKLEKEFLQIFGQCFYRRLSITEKFENKSPLLSVA
jgi:hypothetical protein